MTTLFLPIEVNGVALTIDYDIAPTATRNTYAVNARVNLTPDSAKVGIAAFDAHTPWRENNGESVIIGSNERAAFVWAYGKLSLELIISSHRSSETGLVSIMTSVMLFEAGSVQPFFTLACADSNAATVSASNTRTRVFVKENEQLDALRKNFKGDIAVIYDGEEHF